MIEVCSSDLKPIYSGGITTIIGSPNMTYGIMDIIQISYSGIPIMEVVVCGIEYIVDIPIYNIRYSKTIFKKS